MAGELRKAAKAAHQVLVVVGDRDLHGRSETVDAVGTPIIAARHRADGCRALA
jgi:hypothetical protein